MKYTYKTYCQRIIPKVPTILGMKLLPLSLGHLLILQSENSIFLNEDFSQVKSDYDLIVELVLALMVCSATYDEIQIEKHNGTFQANAKEYITKLCGDLDIELNKSFKADFKRILRKHKLIKSKYFNLNYQIRMFLDYLRDGQYYRKFEMADSNENDVCNNPIEGEESIKDILMSETTYTRKEILELPFNEIISAYQNYSYRQGVITIQSKAEFELKQKLKGDK